jgi:CubicO group peptidase (beta-lactamase class C family)
MNGYRTFHFKVLWLFSMLVLTGCVQTAQPSIENQPPRQTQSPIQVTPTFKTASPTQPGIILQDQILEQADPAGGWKVAVPETQGMDSEKLAQMFESVRSKQLPLNSLLIVRNGFLVTEAYFYPYDQNTKHVQFSCTKSVISALMGIAISKGIIHGVDQPMLSFFPGKTPKQMKDGWDGMILEDVLTMRTGLDWKDRDSDFSNLYRSGDWVQFMLDLPVIDTPGSQFIYCSGCSHLLSAAIEETSGSGTLDFARSFLFGPLGISDYSWETDRSGIPIGGWGLSLTPRDMAKFGFLYLHRGEWNGQQVIPASWVQASVEKHTDSDSSLGYGYQWWVYPKFGAFTALGREGQTIFVIPDLNMVIVTTAQGMPDHEEIFGLIEDYIVPASSSTPLPENPAGNAQLNLLTKEAEKP